MSVRDECYNLATGIFKTWIFIDAARRYTNIKEGEKALTATVNARAAVYDAHGDEYLTESEAQSLHKDLKDIQDDLSQNYLDGAKERLDRLSEQVFMSALQKVVACECGK